MVSKKTNTKSKDTKVDKKSTTEHKTTEKAIHKVAATKKAKIIHKKQEDKKNKLFVPIIIAAIVIIAILGASYAFWGSNGRSEVQDEVLVTINGNPLYKSEFDTQWQSIPQQAKLELTKEKLLNEMIQEKLLLEEAIKANIEASESEIQKYIDFQLQNSGITQEQFNDILKQQGSDLETLKEIYKKQLTIAKLFENEIAKNLSASNEDIEAYFEANIDKFTVDEQVTVRHILIEISENFNESQAQVIVEEILAKMDNGSDFCTLTSNYSMDPGSKNNCGEYTFGRGMMVAEFETASFEMNINEVRTVKTQFGLHIIKKISEDAAKNLTLDDIVPQVPGNVTVRTVIDRLIVEDMAKDIYDEHVSTLYENAKIVYSDIAQKENETDDLTSLAKCLSDKGAKMYGAHWCAHCNAQKEMFGASVDYLPYVECDETGDNPQVSECQSNGIEGFPTWVINGEKYPGRQDLDTLRQLADC